MSGGRACGRLCATPIARKVPRIAGVGTFALPRGGASAAVRVARGSYGLKCHVRYAKRHFPPVTLPLVTRSLAQPRAYTSFSLPYSAQPDFLFGWLSDPVICHGDYVEVDTTRTPRPGDCVMAEVIGAGLLVKRYEPAPDGGFIVATNADIRFPLDEHCRIVGVVISCRRRIERLLRPERAA